MCSRSRIQLILGQVNATEMDRCVFMVSNGSATTAYCAVVAPIGQTGALL